jgi:hypothetical protein
MIFDAAVIIGSLWIMGLYTAAGVAMTPHLRGKQAVYIRTNVLFVRMNILKILPFRNRGSLGLFCLLDQSNSDNAFLHLRVKIIDIPIDIIHYEDALMSLHYS